jgi:hypothetical protein
MKHYNVAFIGRKKGGELRPPMMKFTRNGMVQRVIPKMFGGKLFYISHPLMRNRVQHAITNSITKQVKGNGLKKLPAVKGPSMSKKGVLANKRARIEAELKKAFK